MSMKSLTTLVAMALMTSEQNRKIRTSKHSLENVLPPTPKGLKIFNIDGVEVWAINEKNAIRKAKKLTQTNLQ